MTDLFDQIKNAILTSKQFYEKAQNIEKFCKNHQGKDYDDFSFTVTDRFSINVEKNSVVEKEKFDSSDLIYYSLMKEYLTNIELRLYLQNRITIAEVFQLSFDGYFVLNTKFTIHYLNSSDSFKLRSKPLLPLRELWEKEMMLYFRTPKNSYELYDACQQDNAYAPMQGGIIGYVDNEKQANAILEKTNRFHVILRYLNEQLKSELLQIFRNIPQALKNNEKVEIENQLSEILNLSIKIDESFIELQSDKYMRVTKEKGQYLINLWLDKNCPGEFRKIIGNFTSHPYWSHTSYEGDFAFSYLHLSDSDFEYSPNFEFKFRKIA
jgi:hypothetical protein